MVANPVIENDYYDAERSLNDSKNTFLGNASFRFASTKRERMEVK